MSTLNKVTKKCAVCGKEHTYVEVVSTMTSGHMDLDTRPPQMKRATLEYEIQFCDNCHYANDDIEVHTNNANIKDNFFIFINPLYKYDRLFFQRMQHLMNMVVILQPYQH